MGEITRDIIDSQFDNAQVASYDLSILLGVDRFFCAIKDSNQTLVRLTEFDLRTTGSASVKEVAVEVLKTSGFLKLRYSSVNVILRNTSFTLLPERLYRKGQERLYLQKSVAIKKEDKVVVEKVGEQGMLNIFAVDDGVWDILKGHFPVAEISHSMTPLILSFQKYPSSKDAKRVLLEIGGSSFQIVFLDGEELLFANSFKYETPEDFIYYVMMVFDQFRLKPESCPVFLSGILQKDAALYKILFRYIRHIHFVSFPGNLVVHKAVDTTTSHFYFNLFGLW